MTVCHPGAPDGIVDCILNGLRTFTPMLFRHHPSRQFASLHAGALYAQMAPATGDELWLEFGAASGASTRLLALYHHVHSFDSFFGLPEHWRGMVNNRKEYKNDSLGKGAFSRMGRPPFRDGPGTNITWHVGMFDKTVHTFMKHTRARVRLVHIDCDLYSATSMVFRGIAQRLAPGALLVFDELINYPEFMEGELRALVELMRLLNRPVEVLGTGATIVARNTTQAREEVERTGELFAVRRGYWQNALLRLL